MHPPVYISRCATMEQRVKVETSLNALGLPHLVFITNDPLPQFVRERLEQFEPRPVVYVETTGDYLSAGLFEELDCDFGHGDGFMYFAKTTPTRLLLDAWEKSGGEPAGVLAAVEGVEGIRVEQVTGDSADQRPRKRRPRES